MRTLLLKECFGRSDALLHHENQVSDSKFINAVLLCLSRSDTPYGQKKYSKLLTLFEGQKDIKKNEKVF